MRVLELALVPGAIAGVLSIFTSWFWMGVIFHPFQKRTPQTWRVETNHSYALSIAIRFAACFAIATVFLLFGGGLAIGIHGALRCAALVWLAIAAPVAIEAAIFINLHPWVVVGQLLDWLTSIALTCALAAWWTRMLVSAFPLVK